MRGINVAFSVFHKQIPHQTPAVILKLKANIAVSTEIRLHNSILLDTDQLCLSSSSNHSHSWHRNIKLYILCSLKKNS